DADDDGGDVVLAPVLVGHGDEPAAHRLQVVAAALHDVEDLAIGDHAAEAVGAQNVDVTGLALVALEIDLDVVLHPQRARDDVLGQLAPLLVRHVRHGGEVVVHQRVVAGHLLDLAAAHAVRATVTDVAEIHAILAGRVQRADDRRAHTAEILRARAVLVDFAVREAYRGQELVFFVRQIRIEV